MHLAKKKDGLIRNLADLKTSSAEVELLRTTWEEIINAKLQEQDLPTVSRKSVKDRQEPRLAKPFFPRWMVQWEQRNGAKHPRRIEWEVKDEEFRQLVDLQAQTLQQQQELERQEVVNTIVELVVLGEELTDSVYFTPENFINIYDSDSDKIIAYSISETENSDLPILKNLVIQQIWLALHNIYNECLEICPNICYERDNNFYFVVEEVEYL